MGVIMFKELPPKTEALLQWGWKDFEGYYQDLLASSRQLTNVKLAEWLSDWSRLSECFDELYSRVYLATTQNSADEAAEKHLHTLLDQVYPPVMEAEQKLKEKLLSSGLEPAGFTIPLRNMRAEAALFRQANLPLLAEEHKMGGEYDKIIGAQTVEWEGKETTLAQLRPVYFETDRARRERAWRLTAERQLADRGKINALWEQFVTRRQKIAANAGMTDYRSYRWQQLLRFDYSPQDCRSFQDAIEKVVVPAATRVYERRRQRMGLDQLKPWDLDVDPLNRPPLKPYHDAAELTAKTSTIFHQVDPQLGKYFDIMLQEGLLDLENRKNKAPGAYCTSFATLRRPFIFENAVGLHDDVQTLLHEGGHAFHVFESAALPYIHQLAVGMEFAEVASMSMELLASPYLTTAHGGFYSKKQAARALIEHLETSILFWPYMAILDAFQHWVYTNPDKGSDPAQCDACWTDLWRRFRPGVDWSGFEDVVATGWQRKPHIHTVPFYYVEYGLAQLGAVQVWGNARKDQAKAVASYRKALALGGTVPLPELFQAAGARFAFDDATLQSAVDLMQSVINQLETA
jgi:oligoendopeptidase F